MNIEFDIRKIYNLKNDELIKIIENTNNSYAITNYGNIISLNNTILLKSNIGRDGYLYNCIRINKKNIYIKPHRLVALYFIPNPNNYSCVNHIDENKLNNHHTNLEWCNHSYNNTFGSRLNKCSKSIGIKIDVYLYKNGNITFISTENSIKDCSIKYKVGFNTIYNSLRNKKYNWRKTNEYYIFKYSKSINKLNELCTFKFNRNDTI